MGRRKIEMAMVKDGSSRQVTFSKRRNGVFKKANELATLCGAEVAVVAFSPGGKPFSFGQPSVGAVSDRFLHRDQRKPNHGKTVVGSSKDGAKVSILTQQLNELLKQLYDEKKRGEMLEKAKEKSGYKAPIINEMGLQELGELKGSLERLREDIKARVNEMEASSSLLLLAKKPVHESERPVAKKVAKSYI
ncbi:hypothetical protein F2P56_009184 [Juglans regia]|uniref:MADS-box domain-containing protein n=2 Tax=Juglans regia TaxID=51240 RepID=A0A833XW35_JUGRE|nr:agamous-like MADS-box protein AGL29 [Juglans regia]KAF5472467.1 hypothetical protein F2P56_009184 [Juglans regia]